MEFSKNTINTLISLAREAGEAILTVYRRQEFDVQSKSDSSPLTEADLAANKVIENGLKRAFPDIDIISEEGDIPDWNTRQNLKQFWLIDPLDGTKEFVKRTDEFTVNIALIESNTPIFGIVYAPAKELLYYGGKTVAAEKQTGSLPPHPIKVKEPPSEGNPWLIVGSQSHRSQLFDEFVQQFSNIELLLMGSSLKMCLVAEGAADLYPRLGPTCHWDTAAAHAIVNAAGGKIIEFESHKELTYNNSESLLNPYFLTCSQSYQHQPNQAHKDIPASPTSKNVVWQDTFITKAHRADRFKQKPAIIWFTGLSGSGKSTTAQALEQKLFEQGHSTYLLDGDNIRHGLCSDLGFSDNDREENIRRIGEVAKLMLDSGMIVLVSFISPFIKDRQLVRNLVDQGEFIEVYVNTPISVCEKRDAKGLYKKARAGEIKNFTGIDSPYEEPSNPELKINTNDRDVDEIVDELMSGLRTYKVIRSKSTSKKIADLTCGAT